MLLRDQFAFDRLRQSIDAHHGRHVGSVDIASSKPTWARLVPVRPPGSPPPSSATPPLPEATATALRMGLPVGRGHAVGAHDRGQVRFTSPRWQLEHGLRALSSSCDRTGRPGRQLEREADCAPESHVLDHAKRNEIPPPAPLLYGLPGSQNFFLGGARISLIQTHSPKTEPPAATPARAQDRSPQPRKAYSQLAGPAFRLTGPGWSERGLGLR